jgi:membrane protease YdiL (CAAX protease family)
MTENRNFTPLPENLEPFSFPPTKRKFPVWSGWDLLFLLGFSAFSALMLAAIGDAVKHIAQVRIPAVRFLLQPMHEGVYLILFQAVLDFLILLFIYFTVTLKYDAPFLESIKWKPKERIRLASYLPLGILLALAVVAAAAVFPSPNEPPLEKLLRVPLAAFLFAALGVLVAPFVEEIIFRGFVYPVVERRLGTGLAVVASALLFAGVHVSQLWGSWPAIALITVVGFTLSAVRAKTDSLFPGFVIHLSYNSTICLLFLVGILVDGFPAER